MLTSKQAQSAARQVIKDFSRKNIHYITVYPFDRVQYKFNDTRRNYQLSLNGKNIRFITHMGDFYITDPDLVSKINQHLIEFDVIYAHEENTLQAYRQVVKGD